jgi:RecA-family ATPase
MLDVNSENGWKPGEGIDFKFQALNDLENVLPIPEEKNTYTYAELHANKDNEQKFLLDDLLPAYTLTLLIGEDGIGKTQLMGQLSANVCLGHKDFLGIPLKVEHNRALFVATEDSKEKFTNAFTKQMYALAPTHDPAKTKMSFMEAANLDDLDGFKTELSNELLKNPTDVVVADALGDMFTWIDGDINNNSHARKILGVCQQICNVYHTTMIIIHHAAKTKVVERRKHGAIFIDKTDSQGAGAITQKPRTVLALTHDPRTVTQEGVVYTNYLHVVKANLMPKTYEKQAIQLEFNGKTLLHTRVGLIDIELMQNETKAEAEEATKTRQAEFNKQKRKPDKVEPQQMWRGTVAPDEPNPF